MGQLSTTGREAILQNERDGLQNTFRQTLAAQGMRAWRNGRRKRLKISGVAARAGLWLQNIRQKRTGNDRTNRELQNSSWKPSVRTARAMAMRKWQRCHSGLPRMGEVST